MAADKSQVDRHDAEGAELFLRERARVNRHIATIPYDYWPHSADVQRLFAVRFEQIADLLRELAKDAARYRFWRKHYSTEFVLQLDGKAQATAKFSPSRPATEWLGPNYEAMIEAALDAALLPGDERE